MEFLAHSAKNGSHAQTYSAHVNHVTEGAVKNAKAAAVFSPSDGNTLIQNTQYSAQLHDLGKLEAENQAVLRGENAQNHLPINHVDAGVAALQQLLPNALLAWLTVYSHHHGLPDIGKLSTKEELFLRDLSHHGASSVRELTNQHLSDLLQKHQALTGELHSSDEASTIQGDVPIQTRILLSCLVDADHSDTARQYGKHPKERTEPSLHAEERLRQLDDYVASLKTGGVRSQLRSAMYEACKEAEICDNIAMCDSPVGSGKTTAIMAHLLTQAIRRKSRRIFVVLPFTNIIQQSVDIYRNALVLPDENPEEIVAELHHRADFEDEDTRILTAQWRAPIVVTTAVAFFETLASHRPAGLRRLHELPGSVIFVDEAHAALPVRLLPITWRWMNRFADEWNCYWVLASGSLVKFWEIKNLFEQNRSVPQIVRQDLREQLEQYERHRINFPYLPVPLSRSELAARVRSAFGPRLLIMNTVQSAAVLARDLQELYEEDSTVDFSRKRVLHLSTALHAEDRASVIQAVKQRLQNKEDSDWVLVATSCVEAGVDFSFRTGFRELASLLSLLQTAGRINRSGEYEDAHIWSFTMQDGDSMLSKNKGLEDSVAVLKRYFEKNTCISPALSTDAIQREASRTTVEKQAQRFLREESAGSFETIGNEYRVIDADTVLAVADPILQAQIKYGTCDWRQIQKKAFTIYTSRVKQLHLSPLAKGIYAWNHGYDSFLGYMCGVLNQKTGRT